jgi:hypothetical protein
MNIGFDLDKIFINYPPFLPSVLFDKFYKKRDNGVLLYRIPTYPEQLFRKFLHLPIMRPPIKENLAVLKSISKKSNKLFLISSRYKFLEPETTRLVKRYHLDKIFTELYFNFENKQPHLFKNDVLKKLKLDMYIDDDLSLLKHVAKDNPKTKFFWLTPFTKDERLPKNIFPITQLSEIVKGK